MKSRVVASLLTLMVAVVLLAGESGAQAKGPKSNAGGVVLPITGTTSTGGTFDGLFGLQRFASDASGGILAVGVISGTVMSATGAVVGTILSPVSLPVADPRLPRTGFAPTPSGTRPVRDNETPAPAPGIVLAQATTCDVLNLAIGAVDLNVLGLVVHTDPIALAISGDTGGPLGALICLVLNAVGSIVNLLNTILGLLGGLTGGLGA
jgi:hypothetical protein